MARQHSRNMLPNRRYIKISCVRRTLYNLLWYFITFKKSYKPYISPVSRPSQPTAKQMGMEAYPTGITRLEPKAKHSSLVSILTIGWIAHTPSQRPAWYFIHTSAWSFQTSAQTEVTVIGPRSRRMTPWGCSGYWRRVWRRVWRRISFREHEQRLSEPHRAS
jgi:hypothetical protein